MYELIFPGGENGTCRKHWHAEVESLETLMKENPKSKEIFVGVVTASRALQSNVKNFAILEYFGYIFLQMY